MSEKPGICFIAATLGKGGAEKQAYYLVRALKEHGHRLKLIYFEPEDWWKAPISELGVEVVRIESTSKKSRIIKLYKLLKKGDFDIIQALHYHMNPYVALLGLMLGAKSVGAFRGDGERELLTVNKYVRNMAFRLCSAFICNSRNAMDRLSAIDNLNGKLQYLPNIVEVPDSPIPEPGEVAKKFLAVNSLVDLKKVDRILGFIAQYRKRQPDVSLKILGDGPLRNELEHKAKQLGIDAYVRFEGQVDNVSDYYREADVFMLASVSEGTPNVILEAMSHGKIIISSRVGESVHLLGEGKYGLLIDFNREEDIENTCHLLIDDWAELKVMGTRAYQTIQEHHSYKHLYSNISTIYQTM